MALVHYFHAARPKTLVASWTPVLAGTVLAFKMTALFNGFIFLCTVFSSLFIQIATNYINDVLDFKRGADTADRLGPPRMTQAGHVDYKRMITLGFIFLALAALLGIPLLLAGGLPILGVGAVSLLMAYLYTGGPFPLAYVGLGDLFVLIFFGIVAVEGSFYLQAGKLSTAALVAGFQIGFLAVALIAINNLRDSSLDAAAGKKTLAVRFGVLFGKSEIFFCTWVPYVLGFYYLSHHWNRALGVPLLAFPLGLGLAIKISRTAPGREYNRLLALAGAHQLVFGLLLAVGIFFS